MSNTAGTLPKKLLVIRHGALGDCIHVLPSLAALRDHAQDVELHWLTAPVLHPLLASHVDVCWDFTKPSGVLNQLPWLLGMATQFKDAGIDGVVNLHPSLKTHILCQLLGVPTATYRKEKLPTTGEVSRSLTRLHATENFYQPFRQLWPALPKRLPHPPVLNLPSRQHHLGEGCHIAVILGVGNKRPNRGWPLQHWQEWCGLLPVYGDAADQVYHLHLIGGPDEVQLAESFLNLPLPDYLVCHNHVGQTSLVGMAQLLRQCQLTIGGDTGPLHVAGAAGCPNVLGLFAPTAVDRTGPKGSGTMKTLTPSAAHTCWPCEQPTCQHASHPSGCMAEISPQVVAQACGQILGA